MEGFFVQRQYTALVKQEGERRIGWSEEVARVNFQERSKEDSIESPRLTLQEALDFNRDDVLVVGHRLVRV
jgi:hypothetical protein